MPSLRKAPVTPAAYILSCEYAVKEFARAHQPGIYKNDYLEELAKRYNDGDREGLDTPDKPEWYYLDQSSAEVDDEGDSLIKEASHKPHRRKERAVDKTKFAIESSNVSVVAPPGNSDVQRRCQEACSWER